MLLLEITAALFTLLFIVSSDYSQAKKPFDEQKKPFNWKYDWWRYRNDNVIVKVIAGVLGAISARELAVPFILKYMDWPELAEGSIDIVGIIICTFGVSFLANKIFTS